MSTQIWVNMYSYIHFFIVHSKVLRFNINLGERSGPLPFNTDYPIWLAPVTVGIFVNSLPCLCLVLIFIYFMLSLHFNPDSIP